MRDDAKSGPIITKYRPKRWAEVCGHEEVRAQLQRAMASPARPHAYLFSGPSGVGKTTMARLVGDDLNAEVVELDAATHTGVDAMRELVELGQHMPISGVGTRMIILDEAHMLSRSSFNALLKILEEPPSYLYLALCTTEPARIPETIQTRTYPIHLRALPAHKIEGLAMFVAEAEGWTLTDAALRKVIQIAEGRPRKALTVLQAVNGVASEDEINRIVDLIESGDSVRDLCRLIANREPEWRQIQQILAGISEQEFEAAQQIVCGYFAAVMVNSENEARAKRTWNLINALTFPTATFDRRVAFLAAIGRMIWSAD